MPPFFSVEFFIIWGLVGVGFLLAWRRGDGSHWRALRRGGEMFLVNAPRIAAALLAAGFIAYLLPQEIVARWLGEEAGWTGILIGSFVGALFPGGPLVIFPVVVALLKAGAGVPAIIAFLTSAAVLGLHRILIFELPLMGSWFVSLRLLASIALPSLSGILAALLVQSLGTPSLGP